MQQIWHMDGAADSRRAAQRIIAAYHVSRLLDQADEVLIRSLMSELPDTVGSRKRQQIKEAINDLYQVGELTRVVRKRLVRQARSAGRTQALAKAADALESSLASRMLELQRNAGDKGFAQRLNAFLQHPMNPRRKQRLEQLQQLMHSMGIIDVQTAFRLTLIQAMAATHNAVVPSEQDISHLMVQRSLARTRKSLKMQMSKQVPWILLYVYRHIDDTTLEAYVDMQSSTALVWTNQALVDAIRAALADAGSQLPQRVR